MTRRLTILTPLAVGLMAGSLLACSVPVFRYALEHWQPDPYLAIVFHRGGLTDAQQALVDGVQPAGSETATANLEIRTIDLDTESDPDVLALWEQQQTETLPWIVLKAPPKQGPPPTVWAGELSEENATQILESPARHELQQRLINGDSVVWVFLDSGNQETDDAAWETLQTEVERLQQVLELPEIEEGDLKDLSVDPTALKLRMSSLRVSRDDPAERLLVEMLLHVEPDLIEEPFVDQPMAFPVFGRGRALYALVGDGIVPETIEDAGQFLTGACQCTVKAQNPGVDLLLAVDWDRYIQPALPYDTTEPALAGFSDFIAPKSESANDAVDEVAAAEPGDPEADNSADANAPDDADESSAAAVADSRSEASDRSHESSAPAAITPVTEDEGTGGLPVHVSKDSSSSVTGNVLLVMGLLAMCVVVATMVLIPRSR